MLSLNIVVTLNETSSALLLYATS